MFFYPKEVDCAPVQPRTRLWTAQVLDKKFLDKQVLTTAEAAKLLGVSVRTAQLLIESGPLKSWKTPGGHRRVYLADVLAYMTQNPRAPEYASALVILVATPERRAGFDALLDSAGECLVELCSDAYIAAFATGVRLPAAVIVDLDDEDAREQRLAFLRQLPSHSELSATRFIVVTESDGGFVQEQPRVLVTTSRDLASVLRSVLAPTNELPQLPIATEDSLSYPLASKERQRLLAVEKSGLLGSPPEAAFDRLTWLASQLLHMPVSLMTVLSPTHQHFKSRVGLDITQTPRSWAICNHTILQRHVYSVADLASAPQFVSNPAVAGPPHFRFYAGAPVFDPDGFALGSICVMDYEPHKLNDTQEQALLALAAVASDEIRMRVTHRAARSVR